MTDIARIAHEEFLRAESKASLRYRTSIAETMSPNSTRARLINEASALYRDAVNGSDAARRIARSIIETARNVRRYGII